MTKIRVGRGGIVRPVAEIVRAVREDVVAQIFVADLQAVVHHADADATAANAQCMQQIHIHIDPGQRMAVADHGLSLVGKVPLVAQQWIAALCAGLGLAVGAVTGVSASAESGALVISRAAINSARGHLR